MNTPPEHEHTRPEGQVYYLPGAETGDVIDADVIDAEVVEESTSTAPRSRSTELDLRTHTAFGYRRIIPIEARERMAEATLEFSYRATPVVARGSKASVRHAVYVGKGAALVVRRWRDAHGASRYERRMRAAEAAGDEEALRYWQEADVAEKQRRHQRFMDWLSSPLQLAKALAIGLASLGTLLLAWGIVLAVGDGDVNLILAPIGTAIDTVLWVWWFFAAYGFLLLNLALVLAVAYAWHEGRAHAEMPQWLAPPSTDGDVMDGLPDEGTIVNALRNLHIRGFNQALKDGWRIKFLMPPTIDGKGWRVQLALPPACPVEEIVKQKKTLAHNLVRFPNEVWPTEPQPSVLDLWVAKSGALSGPVEDWPLLADLDNETTDYFAGVPVGITIKGDVVRGRLSEANYVVGGMMGSGKSSLVITLVLGAMLDPLVDIDVVVMAENADYEPMKPRLRSLVTGAGEETVATCLAMLHELYDELSIRGQALREHDARVVTRPLAAKDHRLRPRIMVIDECQNLFLGPQGKDAIEVASKLMSTARKYAITLVFLTPEPSKDALPRKIITISSNKACASIGDQNGNDAVLGTGSYKAGISAVGLTPKTDEGPGDVGTFMQRGFTAKPGLLRSFYVPQDDAHRVTERALQLRAQHGVRTAALIAHTETEERDLLADLADVLTGTDPVPAYPALIALKAAHPRYQPYQQMKDRMDLVRALSRLGVKVPTSKNVYPVDPATVRNRMAELATADLDDDTDAG